MSDPEVPYLLAGTVAIIGGWSREKGWPKNGTTAVLATGALVLVASVTADTVVEPYVTALGWLLFAAAVYGWIAGTPSLMSKAKG